MKLFTLGTLLSLSLVLATSVQAADTHNVITLTSGALKELDGRAIDKSKIKDMIHLGRAIKKLQFGTYDTQSKQYTGMYLYKNQKYALKQLTDIEQEEEKKHEYLKQTNQLAYDQHMHELHKILHKAIEDFGNITRPFLGKARLVKSLMVQLIDEWCTKTKRYNSGLAAWSHLDGNEQEAFIHNVKTFHDLDAFCSDLTGFLASMIKSCPKAYNQYKQSLEQK
jgi:hypothetical protein